MKQVRITIAMQLTESQAFKIHQRIEDEIIGMVGPVIQGKIAEHVRVRVTGLTEIPLMIDAKTESFRELQRQKRKEKADDRHFERDR